MLKLMFVRCGALLLVIAAVFLLASSSAAPVPTIPGSEELYDLVKGVNDKVDKNGVGSFKRDDIERAMLDPSIKGKQAIALVVLRDHFSSFSGGQEQLTLNALKGYQKGVARSNLADAIDERFKSAQKFLASVNRELYPKGKKAESLAKMQDVNQVGRGNCYLLSGLGSRAATDPEGIRKCISDNGIDTTRGIRTYTVVFPREPGVKYVVDDFTDATLLFAEVTEDSGTWAAVMTRAYGQFMKEHWHIRFAQRLFYKLDKRVLLEDRTDHGSMNSEGLRMVMDQRRQKLQRISWGFDDGHVASVLKEVVDGLFPKSSPLERILIRAALMPQVKQVLQAMCEPRDPALVHDLLKQGVADNKLPATVVKHGGAHEASIIGYQPGTKTADGKHESKYGFVTVRDQAGLYDDEQKKVTDGKWWREPGMDGKTICLTVEDFTATFSGLNVVLKR